MAVVWLVFASLLAGLAIYNLAIGLGLELNARSTQRRLVYFVSGATAEEAKKPVDIKMGFLFDIGLRAGSLIERAVGLRLSSGGFLALLSAEEKIVRLLKHAGLGERMTYEQFTRIQLAFTFVSGVVGLFCVSVFGKGGVFFTTALLAIGLKLPEIKLLELARERKRNARQAVLEAVDLLAVGVGSGMSLDRLLRDYGRAFDNVLAEEIEKAFAKIDIGKPRRESLYELADGVDLDELRVLIATILQAEKLGTPLAQVLADQARAIKVRHREMMKEVAAKAPVKMLFPLVGLVLPALFVVLLGPIALKFFA